MRRPITYLPGRADARRTTCAPSPTSRSCTFLWNCFIVATLSTLLCVLVSALAAYALVRLRMPAPHLILAVLLAVAMFPLISLMVPLFQTHADAGPAQHLAGADPALRRAVDARLHAGAGQLLPGHPARSRERRHDRRLLAPRRAVATSSSR